MNRRSHCQDITAHNQRYCYPISPSAPAEKRLRIPNNPTLPFIHYRSPVRLTHAPDPAAVLEKLFESNGWSDSWRNGIHDFLHYHSGTHEVLGIARGHARGRFSGRNDKIVALRAGDVVILPAGTGHKRVSASRDLLVVGAYTAAGQYDECKGSPKEHAHALESIKQVRLPALDGPISSAIGRAESRCTLLDVIGEQS